MSVLPGKPCVIGARRISSAERPLGTKHTKDMEKRYDY